MVAEIIKNGSLYVRLGFDDYYQIKKNSIGQERKQNKKKCKRGVGKII